MTPARSDALVFFGATGDLAYKKIFPALHAMARRGHLNVPVIGVARSRWTLEQFQARARDSVEEHGGGVDEAAFANLSARMRLAWGPPEAAQLAESSGGWHCPECAEPG